VAYAPNITLTGDFILDRSDIIYKLKRDTDTRKFKPIRDSTITGIKNYINNNPENFVLEQNYPNPFNPITVIRYQLMVNSWVTLKVYNILGQEVAVLVNGKYHAGNYNVTWNAGVNPSGVYFCRLTSGNYSQTKKVTLMK
jgi:hypothetical protein